jgi:hypothetical protein
MPYLIQLYVEVASDCGDAFVCGGGGSPDFVLKQLFQVRRPIERRE